MKNYLGKKTEQAITLIALVITIVILIILAGISMYSIWGENGILEKAKLAKQKDMDAKEEEEERLEKLYSSIMVATGEGAQITISMKDLNTLIENKIKEKSSEPVGSVISYMGNNAPDGYLFCDGSTYDIKEYSDLAEQIKKEFGSYNYYGGDGDNTFAVPDLRGEFLRGTGTSSRGNGAHGGMGEAVGVHQDPTTFPYTRGDGNGTYHTLSEWPKNWDYSPNTGTLRRTDNDYSNQGSDWGPWFTARPTNTSVLYCIKY